MKEPKGNASSSHENHIKRKQSFKPFQSLKKAIDMFNCDKMLTGDKGNGVYLQSIYKNGSGELKKSAKKYIAVKENSPDRQTYVIARKRKGKCVIRV